MFSILRLIVPVVGLTAAVAVAPAGLPGASDSHGRSSDARFIGSQTRAVRLLAQAPVPDEKPADAKADEADEKKPVMQLEFQGKPKNAIDIFDQPIFNEFVTLDFKNADIQNVLRLIATKTKLNILMDPDEVSGQITLHLENVRLGAAMDSILKTRKLAYVLESGGIVRIVPEAKVGRSAVETQTEIIQLNWHDAKHMETTFKTFLSTHGSIKSNEESQSLIITDTPPNVLKVKELIRQIDQPDRQVVIQTRLVDITLDNRRNLQNQWSLGKPNKDRQFSTATSLTSSTGGSSSLTGSASTGTPPTSSLSTTSTSSSSQTQTLTNLLATPQTVGGMLPILTEGFGLSPTGAGVLQFGSVLNVLGEDMLLDASLRALEHRGLVEVLASPRVTTLNNVSADIKIIEEIPYVQGTLGTGGASVLQINFKNVGEEITVKPIITPDKHVRLEVDLEQNIFRNRVGEGALDPPLIDKRKSKSTVIVKNKNTVILGGLRGMERRELIDGVPWLIRIPLIGWMFKDKANELQKTELVLMVTPEILAEALLSDSEKKLYDQIDVQWHLPGWFWDDVKMSDDPH